MNSHPTHQDIVKRLFELKGFTKNIEAAKFLGMSNPTFSRWRNRTDPNYTALIEHCSDLDLNYLFYGHSLVHEANLRIRKLERDLRHITDDYNAIRDRYLRLSIGEEHTLQDIQDDIRNIYAILDTIQEKEEQ